MSGYLWFTGTGNAAIDALLDTLEAAGDAYHYTADWVDQDGDQPPWRDRIQAAANNAARQIVPSTSEWNAAIEAAAKVADDWREPWDDDSASAKAINIRDAIRALSKKD